MEQLGFSRGLLTPLIQYCRDISSRRTVMPYLWSVFSRASIKYFVSRRLSTYGCVSPNVMISIQYVLHNLLRDS